MPLCSKPEADTISGAQWRLSEENPAFNDALTLAIANARTKAEAIATDQGVQLGEALIISENSMPEPCLAYAAKAAEGIQAGSPIVPPPINLESMEVTASVQVTYPMSR